MLKINATHVNEKNQTRKNKQEGGDKEEINNVVHIIERECKYIYNPSQKLSRQMRKTVLFRLATSNVKPFLMTIR